jgi:hypothetical protein
LVKTVWYFSQNSVVFFRNSVVFDLKRCGVFEKRCAVFREKPQVRRQNTEGVQFCITAGATGGLPVLSRINPASGLNPVRTCVEPARGVLDSHPDIPPVAPAVTES